MTCAVSNGIRNPRTAPLVLSIGGAPILRTRHGSSNTASPARWCMLFIAVVLVFWARTPALGYSHPFTGFRCSNSVISTFSLSLLSFSTHFKVFISFPAEHPVSFSFFLVGYANSLPLNIHERLSRTVMLLVLSLH